MITTTLNRIREHKPCAEGWQKLLRHLGKTEADDEPLPLRGQTMEVDRVLWVPLAELTRPDTYRAERWGRPPTDRVLHFFELDDETVWGATAHMLVDLLLRTLA